jgi:hypothetical protein
MTHNHGDAAVISEFDVARRRRRGPRALRYIPGFTYILVMFVI